MIIKGKSRARADTLAAHLMKTDNERVEIVEIRDLFARDLRGAFAEIMAVASATQCTKPLYHANIDPDARFPLTPEQWREAVDALEKKLGFDGQPRAMVMHVKEGREHCHVVWSRIRLETMTAVSDSHNYRKHEEAARDLERRFGHERIQGAHAERDGKPRPARTPDRDDIQQQERHGKRGRAAVEAVKQVKADLTELWRSTDSGKAFAAALAERGYVLAQGDRRDFVVLDSAGAVHSLARRIEGVKTAAVRARMADVERASLPTIEQARAHLAGGEGMDERRNTESPPEPEKPQEPQAADPRDGQPSPPEANDLAARLAAETPEQVKREAALLERLERQGKARREFVEEQTVAAAKARTEQEEREKEDAKRDRNGDVADARSRYAQALADEYRVENPYGSLARAAMNEYGRFMKQQEALTRQIAEAQTPEEHRALELRKQIEGCEYMVTTSQRLSTMSRVVTGNMDSGQARRDDERAQFYQERAAELRAERTALEKQQGKQTGKESSRPVAAATASVDQPKTRPTEARQKAEDAPKRPSPVMTLPERQQQPTTAKPVQSVPIADRPAGPESTPARPPPTTTRQRVAGAYSPLKEQVEAPARASESPRTPADHAAINRAHEAEKQQRDQQHQTERLPQTTARPAADAEKTGLSAKAAAKARLAERKEAQGQQQGAGNAQGKGSGRGGGGRD